MKICFIGSGHIAQRAHAPAFSRLAAEQADLVLAACCDLDRARAESLRERFGFQRSYRDVDEMLQLEKPDAACLLVPPEAAPNLIRRVFGRGIPVLIEKPPALDGRTLRGLIGGARALGVPHQVAFNRRHMPLMKVLRERLASLSGDKTGMHVIYELFRVSRYDADFSTTAIHAIDGARFLVGVDYRNLRMEYRAQPGPGVPVTNFQLEAEFEGGSSASIIIHPNVGVSVERATVNIGGATFFLKLPMWNAYDYPGKLIGLEKGAPFLDLSGKVVADGEVFETGGFYDQAASFLSDLRAGRRPVDDLESALQSVEIAECLRKRKRRYG